jgi:AraC family transcriptional regulator
MAESAIALLNPTTGQRYASADAAAVVLSSARAGWRKEFTFEVHRMAPYAYEEHILVGHRLIVNLGAPVRFGWRRGDKPQEALLQTGGFCLQSDGDVNAPSWSDEMTFAAVAFAPALVAALLEDRAPKATETFAERRCLPEPAAYGFARALAAELSSPTEPLYADALSSSFVLHLLLAHGVASGAKRLAPRGKLGSAQLRATIDLAHERLADGVSLDELAAAAGYSLFQFARMFKATTGMAPHQFVLRLRLERAQRLLSRERHSLAEVAVACGFYDQAHLTNAFRKAFGRTPAAFAAATL